MYVPNFGEVRVLCVGDIMLDRFVNGSVTRISPESPVPVITITDTRNVPGGAANVARNIAALGGTCTLIGVIGEDHGGRELMDLMFASGDIIMLPVTIAARPTAEKIRFVAQGQQLLRADNEWVQPVASADEDKLISRAVDVIARHDVLVLSDYAKGALTDRVIAELIAEARESGVPVVVDPKSKNLRRYQGASVITPNAAEVMLATGIDPMKDAAAAFAGLRIRKDAGIESVLLTRSEKGMTLVQDDAAPTHLPTRAREVFDVSGAGDTVVAALALGIGAGLTLVEAAHLANVAAGIVVGKRGTATATHTELREECDRIANGNPIAPRAKVISLEAALDKRLEWFRQGRSVGFSNGCFDILHLGHVRLLEFARSKCDRLIVGLNSDASTSRLKGPTRPINAEADRAEIIAALAFVDAIVIFDEDTPYSLIEALGPDVLVKGSDYNVEEIVGADIVRARGGQVITFELLPDRSTTRTIARTKQTTVR